MLSGNIGSSALSARSCARLSWSCQYMSTATLPIVAGERGRQGWGGRTATATNTKMIPILLGDAAAMGCRGPRRRAMTHTLPPPHVDGSNNGGGGCGEEPCLLLSLLVAAAVRQQCHSDNGDNGNNNGNNGMHSDGGEHGDSGVGNGKGTLPQPPPPSLPMQLLVLACFVILCLQLF
jgi:hypothetical protein